MSTEQPQPDRPTDDSLDANQKLAQSEANAPGLVTQTVKKGEGDDRDLLVEGIDASAILAQFDKIVAESDSVADLVDKYADLSKNLIDKLPGGIGAHADKLIGYLDEATSALDKLRAAVS